MSRSISSERRVTPNDPSCGIRTPRLNLCPLELADTHALHLLWTTPGVRRFLWDDEVIPLDRTAAIVKQSTRLFEDRGYGLWGAWFVGTPTLTGFGGLWHFRDPPELELLFGVAESAWGRGLGTEIGRAVVEHAFRHLGFGSLRASTDAANQASRKVLERLGFRQVRRAVVGGLDTVFYERHRTA